MTVRLVLNGEYRTGTTILYRIIKDSYPVLVPLYEPTTYILKDHFDRILKKRKTDSYLHGFDPYEYLLSLTIEELKILEKYYELLRRDPYELLFGKIVNDLVRELNEIKNRQYFIQPNNWHFKLKELDCPVIHIVRNPIDQYFDYCKPFLRALPDKILRVMLGKDKDKRFERQFFLDLEFRALAKKFKLPTNIDPFSKFLYYYAYCNYYACQSSNVYVICYEHLIKEPKRTLIKISQYAKIPLVLNFTKLITDKHLYRFSKSFAKATYEKLRELDLLDMVKTFLPKDVYDKCFGNL